MIENTATTNSSINGQLVSLGAGAIDLVGLLHIPPQAHGIVLLTHGVNASETLTHNSALTIAHSFFQNGLATLVVDLFTTEEQKLDATSSFFRTNTDIMQQRIIGIAEWLSTNDLTRTLSIGYFGVGITGAATLIAAAERPDIVAAVVSVAAQLALVQDHLRRITTPTMLIMTGTDQNKLKMHLDTLAQISAEKRFEQIAENGNDIARLAGTWFSNHLVLIGE